MVDQPMNRAISCLVITVVLAFLVGGCTARVRLPAPRLPEPRCTGDELESCLAAQSELNAIAVDSCDGADRRVCLMPFGQVSARLVERLFEHYRVEYGLTVSVLVPQPVPPNIPRSVGDQHDAHVLLEYMAEQFPDAYHDPNAVLIGLTPVDIYDSTSHYRYVFGLKGTPEDPRGIISTSRMGPEVYGEGPDEGVKLERTRKMVTRYIGLLYFGLPTTRDRNSLLYDNILGPADLDEMDEPLPLEER